MQCVTILISFFTHLPTFGFVFLFNQEKNPQNNGLNEYIPHRKTNLGTFH